MSEMIKADTRRGAWMGGLHHLLENGPDLNLVLVVEQPAAAEIATVAVTERVDRFLREEEQYPLHTVAETIFPSWEYQRRRLRGVFETYGEEEFPALKAGASNRWGTYAHRLICRPGADGKPTNPLANLIDKLNKEKVTPGPKTACYEVGIAEGAYDMPLYNTVDDASRHMGGPCLSHISFKLFNGQIHLAAFYRSHDYRYKALGNLLGLARLQACVAREVELPMGTLVVHSSYAWYEARKGKRRLQKLLSDIQELERAEVESGVAG